MSKDKNYMAKYRATKYETINKQQAATLLKASTQMSRILGVTKVQALFTIVESLTKKQK